MCRLTMSGAALFFIVKIHDINPKHLLQVAEREFINTEGNRKKDGCPLSIERVTDLHT